jgi:ATP-binding cassette subfamily B protein
MRTLRRELFAHLQRLPVAFFDRTPVGRLVTRVTGDVEALNELFTAGVVAGLGDLFALLAISVMMLVVDWRLALAAFAVIPFVVLVSRRFQRRVRVQYRDIRTRVARINSFVQERLAGLRVVQLFGASARARALRRAQPAHLESQLKSITVYALYFPAIEVLTTVALASLLVARPGGPGVADGAPGALTVGTVAAFLPARAALLPAAAGPEREVQHPAGGDGRERAHLRAARHPARGAAAAGRAGRRARRARRARA